MSKLKISDSARLLGTLRLGNGVYVAQGSILRSVRDSLILGNDTWVLENSILIGTPETPLKVGSKTVFGHKCIAIGTQIGDLCEIGNGTIFLPGSKVGNRCIFGEGTIIPINAEIPDELPSLNMLNVKYEITDYYNINNKYFGGRGSIEEIDEDKVIISWDQETVSIENAKKIKFTILF